MALQRNVARQNAEVRAEIRRLAELFESSSSHLAWLRALLISRSLSASSGVLIKLNELPEQRGNLLKGIWLGRDEQFWEFEAVVSRANGELLSVERFENVTKTMSASPSLRGQGKPFAHIALEVLRDASA